MSEQFIQYTLMHKDIPVTELTLDTASGAIVSIGSIWEISHVPVGIPVKKQAIDRRALNEWWKGRAIPASRSGIQDALLELRLPDTHVLLEKCLGLSLSDQYWICPSNSGLTWEKVNFFENPFSEDVGDILFGKKSHNDMISLMSPDNTSDGWLRKKWTIINGKRCLIKGGSGVTQQEPYNEVMASHICARLHIPHVTYTLIKNFGEAETDQRPYSLCDNFITPDTELISAWYVMQTAKKPNHVSLYRQYLNCCEQLEIPNMSHAVDQMIVLDYLIVNEDRHQNNFGVIRRADTLEYIGAAPIFDSGTSFWFDKPTGMIHAKTRTICKPFKSTHEEQIRLVTDFSWIDFSSLIEVDEDLREIMRGSLFVDEARCNVLCKGITERIQMLEKIALSMTHTFYFDSSKSDVIKDIAYSNKDTLS